MPENAFGFGDAASFETLSIKNTCPDSRWLQEYRQVESSGEHACILSLQVNRRQVLVEKDVSEIFTLIDDKHVPLARIVWVADIPHFCGNEDCDVEGKYEIRLDADDSLFANRDERDATLETMKGWYDQA